MRGFWNDKNGLTIKEFVYLTFSLAYLFMVGLLSYCMIKEIKIQKSYIDIFEIMTYPILVILGSQFTNSIAEVIANRPKARTKQVKKEVTELDQIKE